MQDNRYETNSCCPAITRYQWLVLLAAWMGWVFDSMDATIYAMVLQPALHELLPVFFNNGIFSGFPIYLPELFPTRLRATGAGFCFNIGRVLASAGPFLTGVMVVHLGGFNRAASAVAGIYLLGLLVLLAAPETRGQPLPD
jgi:hypothetical protein